MAQSRVHHPIFLHDIFPNHQFTNHFSIILIKGFHWIFHHVPPILFRHISSILDQSSLILPFVFPHFFQGDLHLSLLSIGTQQSPRRHRHLWRCSAVAAGTEALPWQRPAGAGCLCRPRRPGELAISGMVSRHCGFNGGWFMGIEVGGSLMELGKLEDEDVKIEDWSIQFLVKLSAMGTWPKTSGKVMADSWKMLGGWRLAEPCWNDGCWVRRWFFEMEFFACPRIDSVPGTLEVKLSHPKKTAWWFGCHFWHFPINIGNFIIPIDELIFSRGVAQPPEKSV